MKKKIFVIIWAIVCCLTLSLGLSACATNVDNQNSPPEATHTHTWLNTYIEDGDIHYQTCSNCNEKKYGSHSYDTNGVCVCGKSNPAQSGETPHTHTWLNTYIEDGDIHYQTCPNCDEKKYSSHSYDNNGDCVCGKRNPAQSSETPHTTHSWGTWERLNDNEHMQKCNGCTLTEIVAHNFDEWVITQEPTRLQMGVKERVCKNCDYSQRITIDKIDYDYTEGLRYKLNDEKTGYLVYGSGSVSKSNASNIGVHYSYEGLPVVGIGSFGVTVVGDNDIESSIRKVYLPNTVSNISGLISLKLVGLTSIEVSDDNPYFTAKDGILFNKDETEIIRYPIGKNPTYYSVPATVKTIGGGAFSGVTTLRTVVFPEGLEKIGSSAFSYCSSIKNISLPNAIKEISKSSFPTSVNEYNNSDEVFSLYTIYERGMYLGNSSNPYLCFIQFRWVNSPITSINTKTKVIANGGLSSGLGGTRGPAILNIPDSVQYIGSNACSLTDTKIINIGKGVMEIGEMAFNNSSMYNAFEAINVSSDNSYYCSENGVLYNKDKTELLCYPKAKSDKTEYEMPSNVKTIKAYAVCGNTTLTNIKIGNDVTSVGADAFSSCGSLTSIEIPDSVESIESGAFYGCGNLTSVTIGNRLKNIGSVAFSYCNNVIEIHYTGDIAGWCMIDGLSNLTELNNKASSRKIYIDGKELSGELIIPDGVTHIPGGAFIGRSEITSITIPDSVINIGTRAFRDCSSLSSVCYKGDIASWCEVSGLNENLMLFGTKSKTLIIDGKEIKGEIILPDSITNIGEGMFRGCSGPTSIIIPDSVTSIGSYAFYGCRNLTSVTIPNSVTSIGRYAFTGCSGLTSIDIPNSVTSIGDSAFNNTAYYNNEDNWENGVLYIGTHLIQAKSTILGEYSIKRGTLTIADRAFSRCSGLTSIDISDSVTSIGSNVFYGCSNLTSVTIHNSVMSIGDFVFEGSSGLTNIMFIGTKAQWQAIIKSSHWNYNNGNASNYTVICIDGTLSTSES